jgi:hypothetical protein
MSEVRSQRTEVRRQRTEVRRQSYWLFVNGYWFERKEAFGFGRWKWEPKRQKMRRSEGLKEEVKSQKMGR